MSKKVLFTTAILAGVLAVAIGVVCLVDFESSELGPGVVEKVRHATGLELDVGRYRLNLVRGLELEDVQLTKSVPGGNLAAHLDGVVFKHRWLPLLSGRLVVERVVLLHPEVELTERAVAMSSAPSRLRGRGSSQGTPTESPRGDEAPPQETAVGERRGLELEISQMLVQDGSLRLQRRGAEGSAVAAKGLNLRLEAPVFHPRAVSLLHALSASGELDIDTLQLNQTEVRQIRGDWKLDNATLESPAISFRTAQGPFGGSLNVNFNQIPFGYTLSLQGDPLDVNAIAGVSSGLGPGRLELDAEGYGTDSKGIRGRGVLHLTEGTLPSTPTLLAAEKALGGGVRLVGAPYLATEAPFHVEKNHLTLESFRLETPQATADLSGTVDLDGPLALGLVLRTPREGLVIPNVPGALLDLLTDAQGWVSLPLRITGTRAEPRVLPDTEVLMDRARKGSGF